MIDFKIFLKLFNCENYIKEGVVVGRNIIIKGSGNTYLAQAKSLCLRDVILQYSIYRFD